MSDIYTLAWAFVFLFLFILCQHLQLSGQRYDLDWDWWLVLGCNSCVINIWVLSIIVTVEQQLKLTVCFPHLSHFLLCPPLSWFPAVRLTHAAWAHKHVHRWQYLWGCVQLGGSEPLPCQCGRGWGQRERDLSGVLWGDIGLGAGRLRGETHNLPNNRRHCAMQARGHHTSMQQDQVQCQ